MIWAAIFICLAISFIFSGIEAGILSVNRVRLKHRVKLKDKAALTLNRLLAQPERLLVTVVVVTNFMNVVAIALATQELVRYFGNDGYWISLLAFLPIYLIGLEVLPKSLFRRFPYRALAALSSPLRAADVLLSPMHFIGERIVRAIFGERPPDQQKLFVAREDFKYLTIESEKTGALGKVERQMIHNVVDFRAVTARQVMVPMEKVTFIEASSSIQALLERRKTEHFDRWPVRGADGNLSGLIMVFDLALDGRRNGPVESFQRRIIKVGAEEPAYSIVRKLRAARVTMAAVQDSEGKTVGIVTWEDMIKRLVSTAVA